MTKRLWQIFGPIFIAGGLVLVLLLAPWNRGPYSKGTISRAAVSMEANVLAGDNLKNQALDANYVPFFGSSELSRMDPFHPSALAIKYQRSYRPFLIGAAGTQSLTHFVNDQTMLESLRGKKAVFIISLQWFTQEGQRPDAFGFYYSPLQMVTWLRQADPNNPVDRYAAKRLLTMPAVQDNEMIHNATQAISKGQVIEPAVRWQLDLRAHLLSNEDQLFSSLSLNNNMRRIEKGVAQLPKTDAQPVLEEAAEKVGQANTTNNDLGIDNTFYTKRLRGGKKLPRLRNSQRNLNYVQSPEYSDFELLLQQFAAYDVDVQFIIPPINQKWADYTGLSMDMIQTAASKVKHQLTSQGFSRVLDLSADGDEPYFMQDTIHLGWAGWVRVDRTIKPFLTKRQTRPTYKLDPAYYEPAWQNATDGWE